MTPKVALVCPAKIVTLAGTVAADVLALFRLTTRLLAGAEGTVTVPVVAADPAVSATGFGLKATCKSGLLPAAAATVPVTTQSCPAVVRLFRYQVPVPLEPVRVTLKVTVVVAGKFCKAVIPERVMAT